MYRCELCNAIVKPKTSAIIYIAKKRHKTYPYRKYANQGMIQLGGKKKKIRTDDYGGVGWEIVEELKICPKCKAKQFSQE